MAPHQDFVGVVLLADLALEQALGDLLHFLDQQRRAEQLQHLQDAVHLVQVGDAELQLGRCRRAPGYRAPGPLPPA